MLENILAKELMTKAIATLNSNDTISQALGKMKKYNIYELPVVENDKLVGYINISQILKKGKFIPTSLVKHFMAVPPNVNPTELGINIAELMLTTNNNYLPINEKGKLVGVVSVKNLLKALKNTTVLQIPIREIMNENIYCLEETTKISKARQLLAQKNLDALPIIDKKGKYVGIFSKRDAADMQSVQKKATSGEFVGDIIKSEPEVKSIMSPGITVSPTIPLSQLIDTIIEKNGNIIVIEGNKPIGLASYMNILELITISKPRDNVYVQLTGLDDEPTVYDAIYEVIQKYINKFKFAKPTGLYIHFIKYHKKEKMLKYSASAKLFTQTKKYICSNYDWNLIKLVDKLLNAFVVQIQTKKEKSKYLRRKSSHKISAALRIKKVSDFGKF